MLHAQRYHILFAFSYLRYGLLLCLIPMAQALLAWDLASFFTALRQDAAILAVCVLLALLLWRSTSFSVQQGCVCMTQGVFFRRERTVRTEAVAVLEVVRPLTCRIFGAAKLTLYLRDYAAPRKLTLYLPRHTAYAAAEVLMPVRTDASVFAPGGFEKLSLVMLSANVLTSWLFVSMAAKNVGEVLGRDFERFAEENVSRITLFLQQFLPAGLAAVAALVFVVVSVTLLYSLLHTAGYRVCRNGGVIINRGGLITRVERRVRVQAVTACDVRVTPVARLLGRYPVYVRAGSFAGGDVPLLVYRKRHRDEPEALLPGFSAPDAPLCTPSAKSPVQYLWQPAVALLLSVTLCGAALAALPRALPVLCVPVLLCTAWLLAQTEAIYREGVCKNDNRTLSLVYTRGLTRHEVCIFTPDVAYTVRENPFSLTGGRCDFAVRLPCHAAYRVRGIRRYVGHQMPFLL